MKSEATHCILLWQFDKNHAELRLLPASSPTSCPWGLYISVVIAPKTSYRFSEKLIQQRVLPILSTAFTSACDENIANNHENDRNRTQLFRYPRYILWIKGDIKRGRMKIVYRQSQQICLCVSSE